MTAALGQLGFWFYRAVRLIADTVAVLLLIVLTADVLWGVFSRYVLGRQSQWTEELATALLVWVSMIGAAIAYDERAHLGLDLLSGGLNDKAKTMLARLGHLVVLLFSLVVVIGGGWQLVDSTFASGQVLSSLQINKGYVYLSVLVCGGLLTLFSLRALLVGAPSREVPQSPSDHDEAGEAIAGEMNGGISHGR